jgi:hypothetical protein
MKMRKGKRSRGEENHDDKRKVKEKWKLKGLHMCKSRENGGKGAENKKWGIIILGWRRRCDFTIMWTSEKWA